VVPAPLKLIKAIAMVILGLLLGLVGTDVNSGVLRFAFGISEMADGIGFVTVAMGMFGIAEIIGNLEQKEHREVFTSKVGTLWPSKDDFKRVTGEPKFPASLQSHIHDGKLDYDCNTLVSYTVRGVHVKLNVLWDFEAPAGTGDTHVAVYRRCNRQDGQ